MHRYLGRISGPLLDRIDLHIDVEKVSFEELSQKKKSESSAEIRKRVVQAREIQSRRFMGIAGIYCNAQMNTKLARKFCRLNHQGEAIRKKAMNALGLSARSDERMLQVCGRHL